MNCWRGWRYFPGPAPRRDTKPLAKALLKKITARSAEVIHAPVERLRAKVDGIGRGLDQPESNCSQAAGEPGGKGARSGAKSALSSWNDVIEYCRTRDGVCRQGAVFACCFLDKAQTN